MKKLDKINNSKEFLYNLGTTLGLNFLKINNIPETYIGCHKIRSNSCGMYYYKSKKIHVDLLSCATLGYSGYNWNWPGYTVNRTPHGVVLHELGHYIDYYFNRISTRCRKYSKEVKITGYAPNTEEWFAEMMKVFISNPDLLLNARPKTYEFLTTKLNLIPCIDLKYDEVLKALFAPDRYISAAKNKFKNNNASNL